MRRQLVDALADVYLSNGNAAKLEVASMYFNGTGGAAVNHHAAFLIYSELNDRDPNLISKNDDANLCLGLFAYSQGDRKKAIPHLLRVSKPVRPDILFDLANWAYDKKDYKAANRLYCRFLAADLEETYRGLIDFTKNRILSTQYHLGKESEFYETFIKRFNNRDKLSEENISLFCKLGKIDERSEGIWESIYKQKSIDDQTKRVIALTIRVFYKNAKKWEQAMLWAERSGAPAKIKESKEALRENDPRRKFLKAFMESLPDHVETLVISAIAYAVFTTVIDLWRHSNGIPWLCRLILSFGVLFGIIVLVRYIAIREEKKLSFILRSIAATAVLIIACCFGAVTEKAALPVRMTFGLACFIPLYLIVFRMREQLDTLDKWITEGWKKFIKGLK